jgi:hypothetical protein
MYFIIKKQKNKNLLTLTGPLGAHLFLATRARLLASSQAAAASLLHYSLSLPYLSPSSLLSLLSVSRSRSRPGRPASLARPKPARRRPRPPRPRAPRPFHFLRLMDFMHLFLPPLIPPLPITSRKRQRH